MVFGCYYATVKAAVKTMETDGKPAARPFESLDAVAVAFERGEVAVHETVSVPGEGGSRETTAGRALFNQLLPGQLGWVDGAVGKRELTALLQRCWRELGEAAAARLGDAVMRFGFRQATLSGLSIGVDVLRQYSRFDTHLAEAWRRAEELENQSDPGADSPSDGAVVDHWLEVARDFERAALAELAQDRDGLNPVHLMVVSGARGNFNQVKQLVAMRGLLASPDGKIIESPFATTFVRSPLTCKASVGVCAKCYGADLSKWNLARPGLPIGVIAAHSIGEPLTQLTLRIFTFRAPERGPSGRDQGSRVVANLPHLDELFEAGRRPGREDADTRVSFEERLSQDGAAATAEYLLVEMLRIYRLQGVHIDDRHFEVIIRQMLDKLRVTAVGDTGLQVGELVSASQLEAANAALGEGERAAAESTIVGVTDAASATEDFVAAATTHGGVPALARAAARKQSVALTGVRNCTTFGKVVPARASD